MAKADLSRANTLKLPCIADFAARPTTLSALREVIAECRTRGLSITLLGGGSNVLLPERLPGAAVVPALTQWWIERDGERATAYVGAGVNWQSLVMTLAERGWWGLENLALIPGACGAAPVQNIGAYGVELSDVIEGVQVMALDTGRVRWLDIAECAFGYRDSVFKRAQAGRVVITQLALRLARHATPRLGYGDLAARVSADPTPLDVARAVCAIRREKLPDPATLANAGSFFKNPIVARELADRLAARYPGMPRFPQSQGGDKLAAGWLIDQCGLKGERQGAFGVHERQALVLVHFGGGTREGLLAFARHIIEAVEERFGVTLEPEPRLL
ncbi:UDP-N-acetylmuramate dehydrogenase [Vreelandella malpeensis]|uniref:UDP-N-acetylenolpyruvoylglucosamine reductase n=1 Tax=Vreelandella malpeensis TaxID=1172368 RepID=A0ABS8DV67_9GAMM|nr:UDP-N-acetylmuramate dehydrogenase [Halomonas malpeensis]MCB8889760.1 UDP-N-acetylmuramate dehydrogenase [Halomonas malpeensis]